MLRRTVLKGIAATPMLSLAAAGGHAFAQSAADPVAPDTLTTSAGPVMIQPINHATVLLTFAGKALLFDPVGGGQRYAPFGMPSAIFVTHQHGDHFDVPTLEALVGDDTPLIVTETVMNGLSDRLKSLAQVHGNGQSGTVLDIAFDAVPAYNITEDRLKYHPKGIGNGYVLTLGDKKVLVAGDTEPVPELEALTEIAVAFLPMNLPYTETGEQAAGLAKAMKPEIVYPYHYGKDGTEPQKFAGAMEGVDNVEIRQRDWYAYG